MYCIFTGASIGLYGTTSYIILFNKCKGNNEIIGLATIFEFLTLYFKLFHAKYNLYLVYIGILIQVIGLLIYMYFVKVIKIFPNNYNDDNETGSLINFKLSK